MARLMATGGEGRRGADLRGAQMDPLQALEFSHADHDTENGTERPSHSARKTVVRPLFWSPILLLTACRNKGTVGVSPQPHDSAGSECGR